MKVFNNVTDIVRNDMAVTMKKGSKVAIAARWKTLGYWRESGYQEYSKRRNC